MNVFVLWNTHELPSGGQDSKLIGVYSSRSLAEAAQARMIQLPGFRDAPAEFLIDAYTVDEDQWREGYVTAPRGNES